MKKGVILAGGNGTRLRPLTNNQNKHLLPVYNRAMIHYPIETMLKSGIRDILIITGREYAGQFIELLGSGSQFNASFTYKVQDDATEEEMSRGVASAKGIAHALGLAKDFIGSSLEPFLVLLGDNIFEDKLDLRIEGQAKVFLKKVPDANRFGVVKFDYNQKIDWITEKPKDQKTGWAVTGAYIYCKDVFDLIGRLKPSTRGEIEITDVNNHYANLGILDYDKLKGFWSDMGNHDSLLKSANWARQNA